MALRSLTLGGDSEMTVDISQMLVPSEEDSDDAELFSVWGRECSRPQQHNEEESNEDEQAQAEEEAQGLENEHQAF